MALITQILTEGSHGFPIFYKQPVQKKKRINETLLKLWRINVLALDQKTMKRQKKYLQRLFDYFLIKSYNHFSSLIDNDQELTGVIE